MVGRRKTCIPFNVPVKGASRVDLDQPSNVRIAVILLSLVCLLSSVRELRNAIFPRPAGHPLPPGSVWGDFAEAERRWSPVKGLLPSDAVVGYISDAKGETLGREYNLAQNVLAPLIVVFGADQKYVIGSFHGAVPDANSPAVRSLTLMKDFGNGVLVFKRTE